ncbi:hypothetical protein L2E82_18776 [Cichorium intybus]|uniref:Uncharacterized protein n=1 Tax=Cichorium intybus TaxID=13427 RepID=A0ACB9FA59_CICIN|nr:hypothetical protein L2E82_18776 [Cichorium intybus]
MRPPHFHGQPPLSHATDALHHNTWDMTPQFAAVDHCLSPPTAAYLPWKIPIQLLHSWSLQIPKYKTSFAELDSHQSCNHKPEMEMNPRTFP